MAVAVSGIGIGTRCFQTRVRDHDGTRCASVIVLKLIGNSIKGKKKNHLKIIFSVESMCLILSIHCSILHYKRIATIGLPYVQKCKKWSFMLISDEFKYKNGIWWKCWILHSICEMWDDFSGIVSGIDLIFSGAIYRTRNAKNDHLCWFTMSSSTNGTW